MKEQSQKCPELCDKRTCAQLSNILMNGIYSLSDSYIQKYCSALNYHRCPIHTAPIKDKYENNYEDRYQKRDNPAHTYTKLLSEV